MGLASDLVKVLETFAPVLAYITAVITAIWAPFLYRKNSQREHARWLFDLYQRFYEGDKFKDIRVAIESGDTIFAEKETDEKRLHQLDDFLNFFEFISYLRTSRQLNEVEIRDMFDYPLRQIVRDRHVFQTVSKPEYGFEGVCRLLKDLGYSK